jgi:hypothetical protein
MALEGLPQGFLSAATNIGVGGIDNVDAQRHGRLDDLVDFRLGEFVCAKPIRAEADD